MTSRIPIADFIQQVEDELTRAQQRPGRSYELAEATLDVHFVLENGTTGRPGLFVIEHGGPAPAATMHKVTLTLRPRPAGMPADAVTSAPVEQAAVPDDPQAEPPSAPVAPVKPASGGGGGGGGGLSSVMGRRGPVLDKIRKPID